MKNGVYNLHAPFERAINYASHDGELIALVLPEIGAGPGYIVLRELPHPAPATITVTDDRIIWAGWTISTCDLPVYDPRLTISRLPNAEMLTERIHPLLPLFPLGSPAFLFDQGRAADFRSDFEKAYSDQLRLGATALQEGRYADGTKALRGLGAGLTPAGDDFLCGFLWALNLAGPSWGRARKTIYETAMGDNLIVNHFLRAAYEGLFFEHFKRFARAFCEGANAEILAAFKQLLTIGATSGADTAAGLIIGLLHTTPATGPIIRNTGAV